MNKQTLSRQLELHEGKRLLPYHCPAGYLTVGVGHNLEANPVAEELGHEVDEHGITEQECALLLDNDIDRYYAEVRERVPVFDELSEPRQHVLVDMAFNMGVNGLMKFQHFLAALDQGDFDRASEEMLDSRWADQVKSRATRLAKMMKEGREFDELA